MGTIRTPSAGTIKFFSDLFKSYNHEDILKIIADGYAAGKSITKIRDDLQLVIKQDIKPIHLKTLIEMWFPDTFAMGIVERRNWFVKTYPIMLLEENYWWTLYDPNHPVYKHFTKINIRNFFAQRAQANKRNINFEFDFLSWLVWWISTGHFHERGVLNTDYQMCRKGDVGPYSWDNVYCATGEQNRADYHQMNKKA